MDDVVVLPARRRLDVDEYNRMAEAGVFGENKRIELIDGELIDMAPIGQGHAALVSGLAEALFIARAGRAIVWPQSPVWLDRSSEPQPDLALLRRRADFYATGERPGPADVLLLVEVADSSLRFDRTVKLPLYARAGIAEFWPFDMKRRVATTYRRPATVTTSRPSIGRATSSPSPWHLKSLSDWVRCLDRPKPQCVPSTTDSVRLPRPINDECRYGGG